MHILAVPDDRKAVSFAGSDLARLPGGVAELEIGSEAKDARHIACEAEIADLVAQNARLRTTIDVQADLRRLVQEALGAERAVEGGGEVASPGE